jgi:DNA-binding beta-propeller fold protein YncE
MYSARLNLFTFLVATFLVWLGTNYKCVAQHSNATLKPVAENYPHVEWVSNWPSGDADQTKKKFKNLFNSILFGINPPELSNPVSVLAYSTENIWVLDQGNKTIFHIQNGVGEIPHFIQKTVFDLSSLVGICSGPNSSILFTDSHAQKIYTLTSDKKKLRILNDKLALEQPTGIAYLSAKKEIWVVETKAHCIAVLNEEGELIKRIGRRGNAPGEFNYPTHICIDPKGNTYITDAMNFRIQVLDPEGEVISVFGEAGDASGYLARPKGIATDSFGNIYSVDVLFHVVQVFDAKGKYLYKFGSQGHGNSEFWMPAGIFIDASDMIYVADTYNSRIQVFKLIYTDSK